MIGLGLTVSLKVDRHYLLVGFGFEAQTDTGDNVLMRLRHTTDGTAVTLTSVNMRDFVMCPTRSTWAANQVFLHLYRSPTTSITLKAQVTIAPANGAT